MTYNIVWEFRVSRERIADFETAYRSDGAWARLFAQATGFIEVKLLQCTEQEGRYLTIDRWLSQSAFEAFHIQFSSDYIALDRRLEGIALSETRIGAFVCTKAMAEGLLNIETGNSN